MPKKTRISKPLREGKNVSVPHMRSISKPLIPKPDILTKLPRWRFRRMDWDFSVECLEAKTCASGPRLSSNGVKVQCCLHTLSDRLKSYETMTWGEIINQDNTGSHFIPMAELKIRNAALYDKFERLVIEARVDEPFSLRIGSIERIWGIVLSDGTFEAVCYDPSHLGWPTNKN